MNDNDRVRAVQLLCRLAIDAWQSAVRVKALEREIVWLRACLDRGACRRAFGPWMALLVAVSALLATGCGGGADEPEDVLGCAPADGMYSVSLNMLPLAGFVADTTGRVCFALDGYARPDTCATPGVYWRRGPQCPDFTYCASPYHRVEYRWDERLGAQRLFCVP